jgi:hypothetical protein
VLLSHLMIPGLTLALTSCRMAGVQLHPATAVYDTLEGQRADAPEVLLRLDDVGMNHSVNMAIEKVAATGMPFSVSVLFACPWYQEAVEILERYPQVAVGVHLALNAEWRGYRWGPVLGKGGVPSLVDSVGYFLGISSYFGESYFSLWGVPVASKKAALLAHLAGAKRDTVNLIEVHVAERTPEMEVIFDMNAPSQNSPEAGVVAHRKAELETMLSPELAELVRSGKIRLVTYQQQVARAGLSAMRRPRE